MQSCYHSDLIIFLSHTHYPPLRMASVTVAAADSLQLCLSITAEMFRPVSRHRLNVNLLCGSDVWQPASAHQQPGLSVPGVNTPQGQTSKTHKAWSINYSEWRRLSVADKCVLLLYSAAILAAGKHKRMFVH